VRPTFRPTCASLLFDRGRNVVQVQRWLGHHKPSFTLDTYVHLLPDDRGEPLDLAAELARGGNGVAPRPPEASRNGAPAIAPEPVFQSGFASPAEAGRNGGEGSQPEGRGFESRPRYSHRPPATQKGP